MSTKNKPLLDSIVRKNKRRTRRKYSAEEKIHIEILLASFRKKDG